MKTTGLPTSEEVVATAKVLNLIADIKIKKPHLRVAQIVRNAAFITYGGISDSDLLHLTDDSLINGLKELLEE